MANPNPEDAVLEGPGGQWGPKRLLGTMRLVDVFLELCAWCHHVGEECPSLSTLQRVWKEVGCLNLRKSEGQHPNCDACTSFKKKLATRLSPTERAAVLEEYGFHLLDNWLDRQADANKTELSMMCRRALHAGTSWEQMSHMGSFQLCREDGMDQAKFRTPRDLRPSHTFQTLHRPALHVQGAWSHGFAFHIAVADDDMKKDTNNNVEVFARMQESIYQRFKGLPLHCSLIQDNTSRECRNSKMIKFHTMLVVLLIFRSSCLEYPEKGHTHGPLDAVFGQGCTKMSLPSFDDDTEVVGIWQAFLKDMKSDAGTKEGATAYKVDEAAHLEDVPPQPGSRQGSR